MAATVSVHEANETLFDAFGVERPWQGAGRPPPYPVPWYYSVESNDGGATRRPARSGRMSDIGRNIDLSRFHAAQHGAIDRALAELRAGAKTSHWMWFVFPQVAGLGTSATARRYALRDLAEARAYLADAVLRERLAAAAQAMLGWAGKRSAEDRLGGIDAVKLRSSLTLFEAAAGAGSDPYAACLDAFYGGERDPATLARL